MRLGDVCEVERADAPDDEKVWLLNLDAIERDTGRVLFKQYVSPDDVGGSTVTFTRDSVLYSKLRPNLNKVVVPDAAGMATSEILPLKPDGEKLNRSYLACFLRSEPFVAYAVASTVGAKMPRVKRKTVLDCMIPVPGLSEQTAIASQLLSITSAMGLCEDYISKLDSLVKSRFAEMFGDDESGKILPLEECCISVAGGKTPSMKHPEYYGGDIPFIKSGDVTGDSVSTGALSLSNLALKQASVKMVPAGSILVVTRSARLRKEVHCAICVNDVAINQDIKAFTPTPDFTSEYLLWAIRAHEQDLLKTVRSVSTSGMDLGTLYGIGIHQAPLALQREFAGFASCVDKLRVGARRFRTLYDSLAQEYFGDTNPGPASCNLQTLQIVHETSPESLHFVIPLEYQNVHIVQRRQSCSDVRLTKSYCAGSASGAERPPSSSRGPDEWARARLSKHSGSRSMPRASS